MLERDGFQANEGSPEFPRLSDTSLKDLAVRLAIAGYTLPEALKHLESFQAASFAGLEQEHARRASQIGQEIGGLEARIEHARQARESLAELSRKKAEVDSRNRQLQAQKAILEAQIKTKRRQEQTTAIALEATRRAERARTEPQERLETELAVRHKLFEIEQACWKVNQPEYERRKNLYQTELVRLEGDQTTQKNRVEKLKNLGVTRTVAGFLMWAGYLGFAATGSAISFVLYNRLPIQDGDPWRALNRFFGLLQGYGNAYGPWGTVGIPLAFVLLLLLAFGVVIWSCDWVLQRFDRRWQKGTGKAAKKENRENSSLSPLSQLFQLRDIERSSFVQLLATIPYLFAAGVVFFLLSFPDVTSATSIAEASRSLVPSYVGAVYSLLATAASLLYVLYVVLPRMDRLPHDPQVARGTSLVKMNWELVTLLSVLVVALAVAALAPQSRVAGDFYARITWGGIAIAMTMSSIGLAYGLIYYGQFKDLEKTDRLRFRLNNAIDALGAFPIIEMGGLLDLDAVQQHFEAMQEEEDEFEFLRSLHATVLSFSDDPSHVGSFLDLWLKAIDKKERDKKSDVRSRFADVLAKGEFSGVDFERAPEESSAIHDINLQLLAAEAELSSIERERAVLKESSESLEADQEALRQVRANDAIAGAQDAARKAALLAQHRREEMIFRAAFGLGERFSPKMPSGGGGVGASLGLPLDPRAN